MMKNKQSKTSAKETTLSIVPGVAVIAVVTATIFAVLFIVLWRSENVTLYFAGIFTSNSHSPEGSEPLTEEIRLPAETGTELSGDPLYTPDFSLAAESRAGIAALLRTVKCDSRYKQTFLISYGSGGVDMVSVMRDGEKYRIEAADVLIVCDGDIVYMRRTVDGSISFENRWNVDEGGFSAEDEIGVPALSEIIAWVEQSDRMPRMTFEERTKNLSVTGIVGDGLIRSVTLTYETGMLLSATAETVERMLLYQCDSVFYTRDPDFPNDAFRIPMG